ncbi:MAG TPA: Hsp20/alpha crystallin family protein [Usitatibacter sp.]|nr:Hsp20/alpha crystallin family protein [Usitatibacter sp.]
MYPSLTRFPAELLADFEGLQRHFEQVFGARGPSSIRAAGRGAFPAINMGVTADAVEIFAFAPGLDASRVDVSVDKGLLTIAGERPATLPPESDKVSVYANDRFAGAFRRVVSLPEDVDAGRVEASYRDGVLKIVVPKRESSKPRRIEIKD